MAGRPRRFGPAQVATGPATVYTCPALMYAEITYFSLTNSSASAVVITVSVTADAAGTRVDRFEVPAAVGSTNGSIRIYPRWVLAAAETLQLTAGTNNVVVMVGEALEFVL